MTDFIISNNNFGNKGIIKMISFLKINNKILSLDLSEKKIEEKSIKYISETIDKDCILEILLLSKNIWKKSCLYIKNLLNKKNIKYVKLNSCKIEDNYNFDISRIERK